ncbi:PTS lactose/cellobiose transporter subunit IIA [Erysipelothrix sp. HDW6C]|uniref:PTS lactose/cellobiose transporter subunit IIA n=1 Tax=Erysipelothrix sp. HDW6C TaxID=2714930 RepID=UPI00140AAB1B|nr:PTS lactose/cellobiose transporter subunit IIA [Erysipelothrix sp. HDW6C]QIK68954.1 PTS lactose/cellobiose transporter subunit IIA [Erysipelothrix sp. HDW6C]
MDELELISFKIISNVGAAKSLFIEAMQSARHYNFEQAEAQIEEGEAKRLEGHEAHFGLIQKEANGEKTLIDLLLMHAEDQLMAAETIKIMAEESIATQRKIQELELKIASL